ncbi:MAG: protein kinase, partial [Bradymonadaceae bacterium]
MGDQSRKWTKFGRYALLEKIGSGGMAEIYRAKTFGAAGFEKEYAIKLIIPSLVDDTEFVDMFINEAKIVVNLYHANIVQVFDLGEISGQYYIAMEYVQGKDLLDILARCAEKNLKIPLNLVQFVTMEMLKGLNFAHTAKDPYGEDLNIIHRDVSPSNILISYAGDVKVGDFGVAKAAAVQRSMTSSDTLKGKVGYMSPEQVMGEEIDSRSDVFSAGIVFFEALSMSRLFVGKSDLDVMLKVRDAEIDAAIDRMKALPSGLEKIIRKSLAKDPAARYQSASDFYRALVDFCYQHSIKVTGNDLSNLMRRLFAEEIEEEKSKRRIETEAPTPDPSEMEEYSIAEEMSEEDREADAENEEDLDGPSSPDEVGLEETDREEVGAESTERDDVAGDRASVSDSESADDIAVDRTIDTSDDGFRFRAADGEVYGSFSWNELIDLIQNRIPHPDDQIAI